MTRSLATGNQAAGYVLAGAGEANCRAQDVEAASTQ